MPSFLLLTPISIRLKGQGHRVTNCKNISKAIEWSIEWPASSSVGIRLDVSVQSGLSPVQTERVDQRRRARSERGFINELTTCLTELKSKSPF